MAKTPARQTGDFGHPKLASRERLNAFLEGVAKLQMKIEDEEPVKQQEALRSYLQQFDRRELQGLMGRAFADALKSPSQKLGTAKPPSTGVPRAKKTKPAVQSGERPASKKTRSRPKRRRTSR